MATQEEATEKRIFPYDEGSLQELSSFLHINAFQFAKETEKEYQEEREKMQKGFNSEMRSEAKRLKTFMTSNSYQSWTPQEMAAAGFYFTGVNSGVQCFCCSLILFHTSLQRLPIEDHKKFHPDCEFILGRDVGNIAKYDIRVKNPENKLRGDKAKYQEEKTRLESFKDWPFYAQGTAPQELAVAGFVFTGKQDTVQCFSCGGCLGNWEDGDNPWKEHAKWFPKCEFLQSKKSSEEIAQYIQSYKGFVGVTGEHFVNSWVKRDLPMASAYCNDSIFAYEELRLDSFKNWPHAYPEGVRALVKAGLFYTGIKDTVQCFSCGGCLGNWVEGDDPLQDHTKYYPNCQFLQNMKASAEVIPDLQSHDELAELMETTSESNLEDSAAVSSTVPEMAQSEAQWYQEAKSLSQRLREVYINASFRHMCLLEVSSCLATDLLLGCDLSLASKHVSSPVQQPVMLSDVFTNLNSVMCVEGEAGSGKTVLLKKIALLWASGCCPLLNRFQLVFYLSLSSARQDQGLANIVCDQLLETEGSVTEIHLGNIIQRLKNQVLFLLDDYKDMCSVPQVIKKLIQKNHSSKTCLLISVRRNRARGIRQFLDTILEIKPFPFYNAIYVLRRFFSHDITRLRQFMLHFGINSNLQEIQKTPLFVAAVCANWFGNPLDQSLNDVAVFKSYMECLFSKHKTSAELLKVIVSSCGELALKGFFSSCFEFSDDDLREAGVDEDEDLTMYLMSKFTAQRLRPIYRFLDPSFQEFLAGMRLIVLLDSDRQEDQDLGLYYLKQMDLPMMIKRASNNFLRHISCYPSTKAGPKIVSHLLHLLDDEKSLETMPEKEDNLMHHSDIFNMPELLSIVRQFSPECCFSWVSNHLLTLAIKIAYQSNTVAACSPFISQYLQGKTLNLDMLTSQYFFDHPESLLLLRSIQLSIRGKIKIKTFIPDSAAQERYWDKSLAPTIQQDCASAFGSMKEWECDLAEKQERIRRFQNLKINAPPAISTGYWKLSPKQYKIPLLEVHANAVDGVDQEMLRVLMTVFSASQHIELHLFHSRGFIESLRPALEQYNASFTKCSINQSELNAVEQELLLNLPYLESLEVSETTQVQDKLLPNLDKFLCLKELSVNTDVFSIIPEESLNLHHMEKLLIHISSERGPSTLVKLIQNSPNLQVFHLQCNKYSDFESLMIVLASCKKLKEIKFSGTFFNAIPFVTILPNFISLKILNLQYQHFPDKKTSEKFAYALGSLNNLEELILPVGDGIHQVAKLIISQCQHLRCLRVLSFFTVLNDDSVMEIAKAALNGGFQKLENLDLSVNHKITEEGYRGFFQALDNLPNLQELNISRHFSECIRAQAITVKALGQCMLRLPSLIRISMFSWLLDTEDITLLTSVKEKHPRSKQLTISWKWVLPFSPIIQK